MSKKQVAFIIFFIIFCTCNVIYAKYILTNEIAINLTTQPFYFEANVDNQTIEFDGTEGSFNLNVLNNDNTSFCISDIQYDISLEESSKYNFYLNNELITNNIISGTLLGNGLNSNLYSFKVKLSDNAAITTTAESANLKITAKTPYTKEINIPITVGLADDNVEVSIDKTTGSLSNVNETSVHQITVKNNNTVPITFVVEGENTEDLNIVGINQNVTIPANTEMTVPVYLAPTKAVYSTHISKVTLVTKVVSPYEAEVATHEIEITTWGLPMNDIVLNTNTIKTTQPNYSENITTTTNSGVYPITDANGIGYYYRGVVDNNYVLFANNVWRIMRVNSDGTVRLILDSPINSGATYNFNDSAANTEYNGSVIEGVLEEWYKNNLLTYESSINQNALFIHDRTVSTLESTVFTGWERIFTGIPTINTSSINKQYLYSKSGNTSGNGYLTYPIGLATAEELMLAGATKTTDSTLKATGSTGLQPNTKFYIANDIPSNGVGMWTMTPFSGTAVLTFKSHVGFYKETPASARLLKPVIEINSNCKYKGSGTSEDPYVIVE